MNTDTIGIVLALLVQTVILVRWGTRLQGLVEKHEKDLHGERGLHPWRHDVVTRRLIALDELLEDREDGRPWVQS